MKTRNKTTSSVGFSVRLQEKAPFYLVSSSASKGRSCVGLTKPNLAFELSQIVGGGEGEFDYFNKRLTQHWAGPEHWRFQKSKSRPTQSAVEGSKTQRKAKKEDSFFDFFSEETVDPRVAFKKPKTSENTTLSLQILEKPGDTLLPEDMHYELDMLTHLFVKPHISVGVSN